MKLQLRDWLARGEFQKVVAAASEHSRTLNALITLTFESDPLIRWRVLDAIGRCASLLCKTRPEALKNLLRRLFWMMCDESGSTAWHAPEAIGEIVRSDPAAFADFIPMTLALFDLEPEDRPPFLPGVLYAIGRIGEAAPDAVETGLPGIVAALTEADPQVRAMAICCLARLRACDPLSRHPELANDRSEVLVYCQEELVSTTVGMLWAGALSRSR